MAGNGITVITEKQPSLWNEFLFLGAKVGAIPAAISLAFMGAATGGLSIATVSIIAACGVLSGAVAGAFYGKSEMEKEAVIGKTYSPPTLFNKQALDGGISAGILGIAAMAITYAASAAFTGFAFPLVAGMAIASTAGYAYMQGKVGLDKMSKQYEAAKIVSKGDDPESLLSKASSLVPSLPTVSKQEAVELESKMKQGPSTTSAVEALLSQRANAQVGHGEPVR